MTEMWERFAYYLMIGILLIYLTDPVASGAKGMLAKDGADIVGTMPRHASRMGIVLGGVLGLLILAGAVYYFAGRDADQAAIRSGSDQSADSRPAATTSPGARPRNLARRRVLRRSRCRPW